MDNFNYWYITPLVNVNNGTLMLTLAYRWPMQAAMHFHFDVLALRFMKASSPGI